MFRHICFILLLLTALGSCKCEVERDDMYLNDTDLAFFHQDICIYSGGLTSNDPAIQAFTTRATLQYETGWNELLSLANYFGHYPDSCIAIRNRQVQSIARLQGASFDSALIHTERRRHEHTLALFRKVQQDGSNQALNAYVSRYLPVIEANALYADSLAQHYN